MKRGVHDVGGSASVIAIGLVAVAVVGAAAVGAVGHATAARVGLEGAADAAALAGADTLAGFVSDDPCRIAALAAELNAARLDACVVSGAIVQVTVVTSILGVAVSSRARAGPPEET